ARLSFRRQLAWPIALLLTSLLLTFFTVYDQILNRTGIEFLLGDQLERHQAVLAQQAIDPWQYRIFPELVVGAAIRISRAIDLKNPEISAFAAVRGIQNLAIFLAAAAYWGRLGIGRFHVLLGLLILAWGISYAGYGSGLAFSTYFDILFYLVAGWLILTSRLILMLPLVAIAAINRETSGLMPIMLAATAWGIIRDPRYVDRKRLIIALAALLINGVFYGLLRGILGSRELMTPYGHQLGLDLLIHNLTSRHTYFSSAAVFSVLPFMAVFFWARWPTVLKRFFWAIVPIWVSVHLFVGVIAEARLLLVPHAVVLLPAALFVVQGEAHRSTAQSNLPSSIARVDER
ncbi:MAG: hypothetical protein ACE5M4_14530, partial [Anaerolineales bacterium]